MTTLDTIGPASRYDGLGVLHDRLRRVHRRQWSVRLLVSLAGCVALGAGALGLATLVGYWPGLGQPPAALRWGLLGFVLAVWGLCAGGWLVRSLLWKQNAAQVARFVETARPELRNDLVNALLLGAEPAPASPPLVQQAIAETLARVDDTDLAASVPLRSLGRWTLIATAVLGGLAAFALLQPGPMSRGLRAVFAPGAYLPPLNRIEAVSVSPGDATIFPGESVTVRLVLRHADPQTVAEVRRNGPDETLAMTRRDEPGELGVREATSTFELILPDLHEPIRYAVLAHGPEGSGRWPDNRAWYRIRLRDLAVRGMTVRYEYPPYRNRPPETQTLQPGSARFAAPVGTWTMLRLELASAVPHATLLADEQSIPMQRDETGRGFSARFQLRKDGFCRVELADEQGRPLGRLPAADGQAEPGWPVRVLPDGPPTVAFLSPSRNLTAPAGGELAVRLRAADDVGLSKLQLFTAPGRAEPKPVTRFKPDLAGRQTVTASHTISLKGLAAGETLTLRAVATDNRKLGDLGGPQSASPEPIIVTVRDPQQLARQRTQQLAELQRRLMAILKLQLMHRTNTAIARSRDRLEEIRRIGTELRTGQRAVQAALKELHEQFDFPPGLEDIRRAIRLLLAEEVPLAVDQAEVLASLGNLADRDRACSLLDGTQGQIIESLQDMLAVLPRLAARTGLLQSPPGSDLDAKQRREKRQALQDALKQFQAEQKKVIAASERLNKKALDDFTPAEEQQLRELQAVQDKWEKFLNETLTDFSRLARQDFANPSLLKELMSVQADVTMAKDALSKKAVEIATACENNGLENAESLTANLEKWLPDEPDRKKWAMEAPETPADVEQAELFTELEDLVGDLLEQEEDLFEEMDDLTSQAFMSGDKGIGWDAMDGPISNMNAQGVTGNQLPNTSEVSGRSGEGRTGKSAGEFVEDKAVGKGGRRTPTRMSDDPFQAGQVEDTSTDPPGGATGGGKLSGSGAQGLEGPSPAEVSAKLKRLAGRQAELVNRAERLQANFKAGDYANFRLARAVRLMRQVGQDLRRGDYRNALRKRQQTVGTLRQLRKMTGGRVDVRRDATATGPKLRRQPLSDAMRENLPQAYRHALEEYYRRLSEGR